MRILAVGVEAAGEVSELHARLSACGHAGELQASFIQLDGDPDPNPEIGPTRIDLRLQSPSERTWADEYNEAKVWVRGNLGEHAFKGFDLAALHTISKEAALRADLAVALRGNHAAEDDVTFQGAAPNYIPPEAGQWLEAHRHLGRVRAHQGLEPIFGVRPSERWLHGQRREPIFAEGEDIDIVLGSMGDRNVLDVMVRLLATHFPTRFRTLAPIWSDRKGERSSSNPGINLVMEKADHAIRRTFASSPPFGRFDFCEQKGGLRPAEFLESLVWGRIANAPRTMGVARFIMDTSWIGRSKPCVITPLESGSTWRVEGRDLVVGVNQWSSPGAPAAVEWRIVMGAKLRHRLHKRNWALRVRHANTETQLSFADAIESEFENLLAVIGLGQ